MTGRDGRPDVDLPLAGVRVLDLADGRCESTGRYLADLGAEVLRIEPPGGAAARRVGPFAEDGTSLSFAVHSINKRGAVVDLTTAAGRELLGTLAATADILLHTARPDQQAALGLVPEGLLAVRPGLVVVSITDFGLTGPYRDWTGSADVHVAIGGLLSRSGLPGLPPLLPPAFLADECAAAQAAWAALVAYANRLDTGRGDVVDFSVLEAVAQVLDPGYGISGSARAGATVRDLPRGRPDARHLYPIFPAADGWVRICLLAARQWQGMFRWLGEPAQFAAAKYDNIVARFAAAGELYPLIGKLFAERTMETIVAEAIGFGVPAAALLDAASMVAGEHFRARGTFVPVEVAPGVTVPVADGLVELDGVRAGRRHGPPPLGECDPTVLATAAPTPGPGTGIPRLDTNSLGGGHAPAPGWGTGVSGPDAERVDDPAGQVAAPRHPFTGLRVLDLGVIVVGAELGRLFADHGAEVIKVENRAFPDGSRQNRSGAQISESFAWGHRNKSSLGLNLRDPRGRELFLRLAASADVVLSNFKPGTMESLGLGHAELARVNPGIIVADSSAFGSTGPWSRRLGYGPLVRATAGLSKLWRYPDLPDGFCDAITIYPDHVAGRVSAVAVLALLLRRRRTGRGGTVSAAQIETIFYQMGAGLAEEYLRPGSVRAEGNDRRGDAPRGLFACAGDDEWCVVDIGGDVSGDIDGAFGRLADVVGEPRWRDDPRFATAAGRDAHRAEINAAVGRWTATCTPAQAARRLQEHGVPAGQMLRVHELPADPQLAARRLLVEQDQPQLPAPLLTLGGEAHYRGVADPLTGPAPLVAEHTRLLAERLLGRSPAEVDELVAAGVLEAPRTTAPVA
ncbi:CoA transferase [Frankia sp. AiPs1]|uniref:CaiB/BaiF CoA-transferase family protein n=1 Tax=Frankia sp. AiPs1 TaxID=573493 RepID=UPI002042F338|nr:CoA transferase [Frankia sp. AiPs1]MCM3925595.1 CoA transferase [Frankia sp. AiPs1]